MKSPLHAPVLLPAPSLTLALALLLGTATTASAETYFERVAQAAGGDHRSVANRSRNEFRNPVQTLGFFGFEEGMSVLEIWPGGGWYAEVLAPAIRDHGTYTVANWDPNVEGQPNYTYELPKRLQA
ncbi:MAG: methyltransferase, partial [Pseudomonadota bacterium]